MRNISEKTIKIPHPFTLCRTYIIQVCHFGVLKDFYPLRQPNLQLVFRGTKHECRLLFAAWAPLEVIIFNEKIGTNLLYEMIAPDFLQLFKLSHKSSPFTISKNIFFNNQHFFLQKYLLYVILLLNLHYEIILITQLIHLLTF